MAGHGFRYIIKDSLCFSSVSNCVYFVGNIALHIFSNEARVKYDLDSLWSLGEEYDDECNKPDDPIVQMLQQNSIYLRGLEPADTKT